MKLLIYGIRLALRVIGNFFRKIPHLPAYVIYTLEGDYPELPQTGVNPFIRLFRPSKVSLMEITKHIRMIANDPRVKGVIFHLRPLEMPFAKIDVLRGLFKELQESGKEVITWSYMYDTAMYYLATASNRITLLPGGMLAPMGLYQQYLYMGDALEKLGLKADFIQITPYKSAGDMFSRSEMSEEVKEMANWLSDSVFEGILDAIVEGREVDRETARKIIDQTPCTDLDAKEMGAIDDLIGEDDLPDRLGKGDQPAQIIPWEAANKRLFQLPLEKPGKHIALMSIEGMIIDGRSTQPPLEPPIPVPILLESRAGDMSVIQTIRQISQDRQAAGVVVYVNSRGGSATASESIRIALNKLADLKPLIIVMGPVAASGGYWVSTPGQMIFAQPNTVTGSIGVLIGKIADAGFLKRLFLNQENVQRGENRHIFESSAPFTERERVLVEGQIQRIYNLFLEHVSKSRDLDLKSVDEIGGGRVWTGRQALENGLIDSHGGVSQAIEKIIEITNLDDRTPIRLFTPGKQKLPPISERAPILKYGIDGIRLAEGRVLCLCPYFEVDRKGINF
jgi:protease-4